MTKINDIVDESVDGFLELLKEKWNLIDEIFSL